MSNELTTKNSSELVPLDEAALELLAGAKTDDFKAGDTVVPWLVLVQTQGGYMKRGKPNYNPEAREGDITDNLTHKLRSKQTVILVRFEVHYTTWKPKGGDMVRQHFQDATAYNRAKFPEGKNYGTKIDADGNEVKPSNVYYILAVDPETGVFTPMVWSLASTQFGKAKKINSLAREMMVIGGKPFIPPIYARLFDLGSVIEHGDDDKSWAGWTYDVGPAVLSHKFGKLWHEAAVKFREEVLSGNVRPALPTENDAEPRRDAEDASYEDVSEPRRDRAAAATDEEIPF